MEPSVNDAGMLPAIQELIERLREHRYIADRGLATALHLALRLHRPILVEGEAGVGKTEIGKVLAEILETQLIRLQCYEGIDVNHAVYEWNYAKQMLYIRALETKGDDEHDRFKEIFSQEFLIRRPLLQAVDAAAAKPPVLLIDEIDRADEEFEAFLLELLSDYQVTVPELGTLKATSPPVVVLTSNRTREIHDALKRRCLYYWIPYPSIEKESSIIRARIPSAPSRLVTQVCVAISAVRQMELQKVPGIAETLDWIAALMALGQEQLEQHAAGETLCVVLKTQDDVEEVSKALPSVIERAVRAG